MSQPPVVLVDRDVRTRPRISWRDAWASSPSQDLSRLRVWSYARGAVRYGGLPAVMPAALACLVLTGVFLAVAFGAAALAASAHGSTTQAALILLASVVLSQVLTAAQNRRLARRLFIAAETRVSATPRGWAIAWVTVPAHMAARIKGVLLGGPFCHVETTYYRNATEAELAAYYRLAPNHDPATEAQHAEDLLATALRDLPHALHGVNLYP